MNLSPGHGRGGTTDGLNLILMVLSLGLAVLLGCCACGRDPAKADRDQPSLLTDANAASPPNNARNRPARVKLILVVVALCDNLHQGIVPVPARLGNGDDPDNNLYWGAAFGVKTFFNKAPGWRKLGQANHPRAGVLEACLFQYRNQDVYMIAEAYQGIEIRRSIADFLDYASGAPVDTATLSSSPLNLNLAGPADLVAYVGHNGLMDFSLGRQPQAREASTRDAMVLCCLSRKYFSEAIRASGARPLLLTTGLMAPEAYVLDAAVKGWISGESAEQVRTRAATAYNAYQKCGYRAALALFTTGD